MNKQIGKTLTSRDNKAMLYVESYPRVSIIVPVARAELGTHAVESLSKQHYSGEIEIIVVGAAADELAQKWSVISANHGPIRDPGKARNLGAAIATGEILLFLDDDCTVNENWVELNVQALQQPEVGAVGGCIRCKSHAFFARSTDFTNFGYYQHGKAKDGPLASASLGMRKAVFQEVGGFDEAKRYGEDEDVDLCFRVQRQGYRTVYQPTIVVSHNHRRDTLRKLVYFNYKHGLASGLTTKVQYRDLSLKNRLLFSIRFPLVFLLLLPYIATAATLRIVAINLRDHREVLFHAPFILLAKLAYEFGIFLWLVLHVKRLYKK